MCIDQSNTKFVEACLLRGIHYVDISASYKFLSQVELLSQLAIENKSSVVLSVGLAPGVTNLLSSLCKIKDPTVEQIDIFIMLGSGERHGNAAYKWAFNDLNDKYLISNGFELDYLTVCDTESLEQSLDIFKKDLFVAIAAKLNNVRLIDNIVLTKL